MSVLFQVLTCRQLQRTNSTLNSHLNEIQHFSSLGRHFTDIHFGLILGRIIPTTISSTITGKLRCSGPHAGLFAGTAGCNFKVHLRPALGLPHLWTLHWMVQSCASGGDRDQHLFEGVEHVGMFLKKVTGKPRCVIRSLGTRGKFVYQIQGKRDIVALLPG